MLRQLTRSFTRAYKDTAKLYSLGSSLYAHTGVTSEDNRTACGKTNRHVSSVSCQRAGVHSPASVLIPPGFISSNAPNRVGVRKVTTANQPSSKLCSCCYMTAKCSLTKNTTRHANLAVQKMIKTYPRLCCQLALGFRRGGLKALCCTCPSRLPAVLLSRLAEGLAIRVSGPQLNWLCHVRLRVFGM